MRNGLFFILLFFASGLCYSASDYYSQKIALSVDPASAGYSADVLFQKSVLSQAENLTNIQLYEGTKEDLQLFLKNRELNGSILLKTVQKGDASTIELYDTSKTPVLVDNSVSFKTKNFIGSLDDSAGRVLKFLINRYPPKPKQQLTTIENVKIEVSEFESLKPEWSIRVSPEFDGYVYSFSIQQSNFNTTSLKKYRNSGGASAEFLYRNLAVNASLSISGDLEGTIRTRARFAYGLFKSLFLLGVNLDYLSMNFKTKPDDVITLANQSSIHMPNIQYQNIWLGSYLQINITKSYSFSVSTGIFQLLNLATLDFQNTAYSAPGFYFTQSAGPPSAEMVFNWTVIPHLRFSLKWGMFGRSSSYSDTDKNGNVKYINLGNNLNLRNINISLNQLAMGLEYVF